VEEIESFAGNTEEGGVERLKEVEDMEMNIGWEGDKRL